MSGADDTSRIEVRTAEPRDAAALAELMFRDPGREAVAMTGSAEAAERLQVRLLRHGLETGSSVVLVAERAGEPIGFAEISSGGDGAGVLVTVKAAIAAMGLGGALRAAARWPARLRIEMTAPPGGLHLMEFQVDPSARGQGIGGLLLGHVERHAVAEGAALLSLTTASDNPARRLYERNGYRVVDERSDARYEAMTGCPGRILMVKHLAPA